MEPSPRLREEIKERWDRYAEFGNQLEQYRAMQFTDITENAAHITDFDTDFMLKTLDHITVYESGKLWSPLWMEQRRNTAVNNIKKL
ncbi:hypothetical protein DEAC_c36930 [Desulfosporosinus acididurans]|uniref:Uncharacterized protein n=1 Tax=Desulfosporosinus acididurans TaxID=476652 RepID=A0A0J1IIE1_9FIRM|nr:hypothetical protein [Desulfosporosinus acididurans]KLU64491.1 hypothetical protein DEAC_c36930 [Desulfosporosinus acididurans]